MQEGKNMGQGALGEDKKISLTSHEGGWHEKGQLEGNSVPAEQVEDVPEKGAEIDALVRKAQRKAAMIKNERQRGLDERRDSALRMIADAGTKFLDLDPEGQDYAMLQDRLARASVVRISETEALAEMAVDHGDFSSPLVWWEIKQDDKVLWKGYVIGRRVGGGEESYFVKNRVARCRLEDGLDMVTCRTIFRGYVTEAYSSTGSAVGIAHYDDGQSDEEIKRLSVTRAFVAYYSCCRGQDIEPCDIPGAVFEGLDYQDKEEYKEER